MDPTGAGNIQVPNAPLQGQPSQTPPTASPPVQPPQVNKAQKHSTIKYWSRKFFAIPMRLFFFLLPLETAYTILTPYVQTKVLVIVLGIFALFLAVVLPTREKTFFKIAQFFALIHVLFIVTTILTLLTTLALLRHEAFYTRRKLPDSHSR